MRILIVLAGALALGACATAGSGASNSYIADLDRLRAQCEARNGTLEPVGTSTGRPETDFTCRIRSGPSPNIRQ